MPSPALLLWAAAVTLMLPARCPPSIHQVLQTTGPQVKHALQPRSGLGVLGRAEPALLHRRGAAAPPTCRCGRESCSQQMGGGGRGLAHLAVEVGEA